MSTLAETGPTTTRLPRRTLSAWGVLLLTLGCSSAPVPGDLPPSAAELLALRDCSAPSTQRVANISAWVAARLHSWAYEPLSIDALNHLMAATRALDADDLGAASVAARLGAYEVVPLQTDGACLLLLEPTATAPVGQAQLVYARSFARDLVIEAPHVPEDHGTEAEAALLFEGLGAKMLILAGAHRCAVTTDSGCRASNQCNKVGVPVESDPSHSVHNAVNAMHLGLRASSATILQLHTNFRPDVNGDARISNGTRYPIAGTAADAFFKALSAPDVDARWCNDPSAPPEAGAFCGESNTQGLASNGAADQCQGRPSAAGGPEQHRFIHLEQNNAQMTAIGDWSSRIQTALAAAIPAHVP